MDIFPRFCHLPKRVAEPREYVHGISLFSQWFSLNNHNGPDQRKPLQVFHQSFLLGHLGNILSHFVRLRSVKFFLGKAILIFPECLTATLYKKTKLILTRCSESARPEGNQPNFSLVRRDRKSIENQRKTCSLSPKSANVPHQENTLIFFLGSFTNFSFCQSG